MSTTEPSAKYVCSASVTPDGQISSTASRVPSARPVNIASFSSRLMISTGLPSSFSMSCSATAALSADAVHGLTTSVIVGLSPVLPLSPVAVLVSSSLPHAAASTAMIARIIHIFFMGVSSPVRASCAVLPSRNTTPRRGNARLQGPGVSEPLPPLCRRPIEADRTRIAG